MAPNGRDTVCLEFTSTFDVLDFVQVVTDYISRSVGFDEDAQHWVSVAIRETVINAIKHGNRNDPAKRVFVEFVTLRSGESASATRARGSTRRRSTTRLRRRTC
jgi:anti-sigma regulatory factor (Ser/Thr protein kinase)